eukprot:TRINITY_DN10297_c0_g1_i1.p1 TRINITY_DN10297_c0_g1~~TRINITY_DN10297_c0_g1_i1.p1  ORF type:complete len:276 (-),score=60.76 TRINITY_DN10297_c0_g1_i1:430-1206(-)
MAPLIGDGCAQTDTSKVGSFWAQGSADWFQVRGATYLQDRLKVSPESPAMEVVATELLQFEDGCRDDVGSHPASLLQRERAAGISAPFTVVFQFQNPGPPHKAIVMYARPSGPLAGATLTELLQAEAATPFGRTLRRFIEAPQSERLLRLKCIPKLVNAPWAVKSVIPQRPVILGTRCRMPVTVRDNYLEIDYEVGSHRLADKIYRGIERQSKHVVVDLAFILEGQTEDELPERPLFVIRLSHLEPHMFGALLTAATR